ncbi:MAG: hypothetical protein KKE17_05430 [Proteobacteria bacterium]|nr:hypothetical protein [Pseudomonadota bacterium]MBU1709432.1 hypothetical protein [Pseudomonadota bacterium]
MNSKTNHGRQSVVCVIIYLVLCCTVGTILYLHATSERSPFLLEAPQISISQPASLDALSSTFILPNEFKLAGEPEEYDKNNLFEKINGKAPLYLEAGFTRLHSQRIIHQKDSSLWLEIFIYDMAEAVNAFAVYSTQRRPSAATNPALESIYHYKTENGLYLWRGRYYLEFIGSAQSPFLDKAMIEIATHFGSSLSAEQSSILELNLFPLENLVPDSFKLSLLNTFGTEALNKTFTARYLLDGKEATAFICLSETNEQAQKNLAEYSSFLMNNGALRLESEDPAIRFFDLYGTVEAFFTHGTYVMGVHEAEDLQTAKKMILQLSIRLEETKRP